MGRPLLDATAPTALHTQISDWIRAQVAGGAWPAHYRLPSEPDLAEFVGVSRGTLRRALSTLVDEELLVQVQGRGTFVAATIVEPPLAQQLTTLSEAFDEAGRPLSTVVVRVDVATAPQYVAHLLEVSAGTPVLHLERVRSQDGMPVARLLNYVRLDRAPGLADVDFSQTRLFEALEKELGLPVASARRTFDAVLAGPINAELLEVGEDTPLLQLEQLTLLDDGTPIEFSHVWLRSDRLRVTSNLNRNPAASSVARPAAAVAAPSEENHL